MSESFATEQPRSGARVNRQRSGASSFIVWLLTTLAASALVHMLVVFALPRIGGAIQLEDVLPAGDEGPLLYTGRAASDTFRFTDQRQDSVFCAFNLEDGAVRISGRSDFPYWSISVHNTSGLVVGSVNSRAATAGVLELIIMRPSLARELSEAGAVLPAGALVVEMEGPFGIARISGLAPYAPMRAVLREDFEQTECGLASFTFVPLDEGVEQEEVPERGTQPQTIPSPVPRPDVSAGPEPSASEAQ